LSFPFAQRLYAGYLIGSSSRGATINAGQRGAKPRDPGKHVAQPDELAQAHDERVSNELRLSAMEMPSLNERDGCSFAACHPAQIVEPQSFALRQLAKRP
jgi:hypothetical protein